MPSGRPTARLETALGLEINQSSLTWIPPPSRLANFVSRRTLRRRPREAPQKLRRTLARRQKALQRNQLGEARRVVVGKKNREVASLPLTLRRADLTPKDCPSESTIR